MSLGISEQCNVSFASFWDLGPRVDPGDDVQARLTAFVDGLRQRNELAPRIDVMLGPGTT